MSKTLDGRKKGGRRRKVRKKRREEERNKETCFIGTDEGGRRENWKFICYEK